MEDSNGRQTNEHAQHRHLHMHILDLKPKLRLSSRWSLFLLIAHTSTIYKKHFAIVFVFKQVIQVLAPPYTGRPGTHPGTFWVGWYRCSGRHQWTRRECWSPKGQTFVSPKQCRGTDRETAATTWSLLSRQERRQEPPTANLWTTWQCFTVCSQTITAGVKDGVQSRVTGKETDLGGGG